MTSRRTTRIKKKENEPFIQPIDFTQIAENRIGQQILAEMGDSSLTRIKSIVSKNNEEFFKTHLESDLRMFDLMQSKRKITGGYLNSKARIIAFWKKISSNTTAEVIDWLKHQRKL